MTKEFLFFVYGVSEFLEEGGTVKAFGDKQSDHLILKTRKQKVGRSHLPSTKYNVNYPMYARDSSIIFKVI